MPKKRPGLKASEMKLILNWKLAGEAQVRMIMIINSLKIIFILTYGCRAIMTKRRRKETMINCSVNVAK